MDYSSVGTFININRNKVNFILSSLSPSRVQITAPSIQIFGNVATLTMANMVDFMLVLLKLTTYLVVSWLA